MEIMIGEDCVNFAMTLVNNVSLTKDVVLVPETEELLNICVVLQNLELRYTDNDMFEILHRNCPKELLKIFQGIKVKTM